MMSENGKNILVVDDVESTRIFIRELLKESDYNVIEASNGKEGIEVYKESENIDLIITDIYMPERSGLELVVDLKEEYKDLKVIVLSNGGEKNFSNELGVVEALGATCFMKKDFIKDQLVNLVNNVLAE